MAQMFAIVYKTGPLAGEPKSYGTVVTGDEPDGPPFRDDLYEKVPIDHQPGEGEVWDSATKTVVSTPAPPQTRRQELKEKTTWTALDRDDAIRELL